MSHKYSDMNGDIAPSSIGADIAAAKGILVVVSAGNEGNDPWKYVTAPADADSVLTIGATDRFGQYVYFSSVGPTFDKRVKPNVVAQGLNSTVLGTNGDVITGSGTSFSGPIIAGMAACLWQARPELSNMQLITAMEHNANQSTHPDSLLGYGVPDFYMAMLYPTKIESLREKKQIQVYPNPFNENFEIKFSKKDQKDEVNIEVYDLKGKLVIRKKLNVGSNNTVDFSGLNGLASGMYIINLRVGKEKYDLKMLKQ
jgi:hypothetical protein